MAGTVEVTFYAVVHAVIDERDWVKGKPTVRVTAKKPALDKDEVPVQMTLSLPKALFKRPQITARVAVADDLAPAEINAEVQDNIAQAIRDQLGVDVRITVDAPGGVS